MDRFQRLTLRLSHIQKTIQRIKTVEMNQLGLKGSHALCISCFIAHPEGLTAAQMCTAANLDKAAVSRIFRDLESSGCIRFADTASDGQRKYRTRFVLTEQGHRLANTVSQKISRCVSAGKNRISDEELERFYETLAKLTQNLDALCTELEQASGETMEETQ